MIPESLEVQAMRVQQEAAERDAEARGGIVVFAYAMGGVLLFIAGIICAVLVLLY